MSCLLRCKLFRQRSWLLKQVMKRSRRWNKNNTLNPTCLDTISLSINICIYIRLPVQFVHEWVETMSGCEKDIYLIRVPGYQWICLTSVNHRQLEKWGRWRIGSKVHGCINYLAKIKKVVNPAAGGGALLINLACKQLIKPIILRGSGMHVV